MKYYVIYPDCSIEFENYRQLVNYIIKNKDSILSRVKNCDNDQRVNKVVTRFIELDYLDIRVPCFDQYLVPRDIKIIDEFGKNVFNHELISDIDNYSYSESIYNEYLRYYRDKFQTCYFNHHSSNFEFRKDPVPYTGKKHRYSCWLRYPHTTSEKRIDSNPEYKNFVRGKRGKHLPSVYDDILRKSSLDISWKRCTKNRHQWENKINCRYKNVDVYKEKNIEEEDEMDFLL